MSKATSTFLRHNSFCTHSLNTRQLCVRDRWSEDGKSWRYSRGASTLFHGQLATHELLMSNTTFFLLLFKEIIFFLFFKFTSTIDVLSQIMLNSRLLLFLFLMLLLFYWVLNDFRWMPIITVCIYQSCVSLVVFAEEETRSSYILRGELTFIL